MTTKLHSKNFKVKNINLFLTLFLATLIGFAQEQPLPTSNTEINGAEVTYYFEQEPDYKSDKTTFAINLVDDNPDTDWAGNTSNVASGEAFLIIDLKNSYDLAEVQLLTVTGKTDPYVYDIFVSTTGTDPGNFTDAFTASEKGTSGYLESNFVEDPDTGLDGTYKSFTLPSVVTGAKYVKIFCYGRADLFSGGSSWSTISEVKFYAAATASVKDNELSGFTLSPNPANNSFDLSNLNTKVNNVQILSLDGKLISSTSFDGFSKKLTIDTSNLANGIYLVKLSDASKSLNASKKMVIQH